MLSLAWVGPIDRQSNRVNNLMMFCLNLTLLMVVILIIVDCLLIEQIKAVNSVRKIAAVGNNKI